MQSDISKKPVNLKTRGYPKDFNMNLKGLYGWMRLITTVFGLRFAAGFALFILSFVILDFSLIGRLGMARVFLWFVLSGTALFLIYKRNIKFRFFLVIELILIAILSIVVIPDLVTEELSKNAALVLISVMILRSIGSILGIIYLYNSSRVRNTFIYPHMNFEDEEAVVSVQEK